MPGLLRLEQQQKRFLKFHFQFAYFSLLLIWNRNDKYVHILPYSLENPIPDQNGQSLHRFQTKTVQKLYPLGRHITKKFALEWKGFLMINRLECFRLNVSSFINIISPMTNS